MSKEKRVNYLKIESWKLNKEQLLIKHRQARLITKIIGIMLLGIFIFSSFTWLMTNYFITPLLGLFVSVMFTIIFTFCRLYEYHIATLICMREWYNVD
jgi:hypothetical protein